MARFISFTASAQTAAEEKSEIVFVNIDLISVARLHKDGSLSLQVHGTRDSSGGIEHYVLKGEEAAAAAKVLRAAK